MRFFVLFVDFGWLLPWPTDEGDPELPVLLLLLFKLPVELELLLVPAFFRFRA